MEIENNVKVCFAASTGGHFEQIMMLKPLMEKYNSFILTEKAKYRINSRNQRTYYLRQVNRKEHFWEIKLLCNLIISFSIYLKEKPDVIITTGVLSMIPMCLICHFLGRKVIYIESFAKVNSGTMTGKLLYKFADNFYVQWENMKKIYPKAKYWGGIY
ncbi:UDP-N-acetylglucosamine--N-acetylmuramyl-(pentapeptide) pyrophosphoryl-undecaprenol N-acetylglucosamine transferase [Clostridiales bacterium CHKCI001]|nr:UDP-N-acetylglucosamine--N-acetylmuramyl-(pentapeptide) pyrophosphoryl-undecaprenol N-acetylglucosamine transferase [Clostridiales bacterium CHKCI001]